MNGIGREAPFNRLTGRRLAYALALVSLLGGAYIALWRPGPLAPVAAHSLGHKSVAQYYWEEASRLAADSRRHSRLALQSGVKGASGGPEAELWRTLADYTLLLAGYELSAAEVMTALAVIHGRLELSSSPPLLEQQEGPP